MDLQYNCTEDIKSSSSYYSFNKLLSVTILHPPQKPKYYLFKAACQIHDKACKRNKRFRDTLEIGDRDIHITWINVSNPENICSHTYKASGFILYCDIAYVSIC